MYIKIKNDFKLDREKDPSITNTDQEITANWISHVIQRGYAGGLTQDKRRLHNIILAKFEKAKQDEYVELNPIEYSFLKTAFEKAVIDPKFTEAVTIVEESILNPLDELPVK